jgi:hypothetical protein
MYIHYRHFQIHWFVLAELQKQPRIFRVFTSNRDREKKKKTLTRKITIQADSSLPLKDRKNVRCGTTGVGALMGNGPVDNSSPRALPKVIKLEEESVDPLFSSVMIASPYEKEEDGDKAGRGWLRPL